MTPPSHSPRQRRPSHGRRMQQNRNLLARRGSTAAPTPSTADQRRWFDFNHGVSATELATREQVKLSTIERSLEVMRTYAAVNSEENALLQARAAALRALPEVEQSWQRGLNAKVYEGEYILNPDTHEREYVSSEREDFTTQVRTTEAIAKFMQSLQSKTPPVAVNVSASAQAAANAQAALPGAAISAESIIREIRQQRGLAAPIEAVTAQTYVPPMEELDYELRDEEVEQAERVAAAQERDQLLLDAQFVDVQDTVQPAQPSQPTHPAQPAQLAQPAQP